MAGGGHRLLALLAWADLTSSTATRRTWKAQSSPRKPRCRTVEEQDGRTARGRAATAFAQRKSRRRRYQTKTYCYKRSSKLEGRTTETIQPAGRREGGPTQAQGRCWAGGQTQAPGTLSGRWTDPGPGVAVGKAGPESTPRSRSWTGSQGSSRHPAATLLPTRGPAQKQPQCPPSDQQPNKTWNCRDRVRKKSACQWLWGQCLCDVAAALQAPPP